MTFDLKVSNVPLQQILKYVTDITGTVSKIDDFAVSIVPRGGISDAMVTRTYRVPPDFLSNLAGTANIDSRAGSEDIFNTERNHRGLLASGWVPGGSLDAGRHLSGWCVRFFQCFNEHLAYREYAGKSGRDRADHRFNRADRACIGRS